MNVRLKHLIEFTAGVFFDGMLKMGNYHITLHLITVSLDPEEHNVAFERMKFFIEEVMGSAILISADDRDRCTALAKTGARIITLPEEPVDQVVGIMLHSKLNAIMEGRMDLVEIEIASEIGGNMVYMHHDDESMGPFEQAGWWREPDLSHCHKDFMEEEYVARLTRNAVWRDLGLNWPNADGVAKDHIVDNNIVFADFNRDGTK